VRDSRVSAAVTLGCSGTRPLTVGSKNFTEQIVLGEIVAQQLERRLGRKVDRKLDLGGTLLAQQALRTAKSTCIPNTPEPRSPPC
jgi:glycine betaine/choline ABC-type transport system substrate-binding protein